MSRRAWIYIWIVLVLGAALTGFPILNPLPLASEWMPFVILTAFATLAQLFKANVPNRKLYYATFVFVFAGLLLLHPFLFAMLVIISYSIEWAKERLIHSTDLRDWYLQPFNIAMVIISGATARVVITLLTPDVLAPLGPASVGVVLLGVVSYVAANQVLLALALVLARGMAWSQVVRVDGENIQADLIHTLLGYIVALAWKTDPWLILPALSPLLLTYRALNVPQLRKDAATDSKTGLWNAGHFNKLFAAELERARRFAHPLAVIMADLDLLRNINNTYGHLAGDDVLAAIGQIIRSTVREYDIAARFGGEEFVIVLPETELAEAIPIVERLRRLVESADFTTRTGAAPIHATMSFGVAGFPTDAATATDLIHQADIAVYQAKLKGRNCVVPASDIPHSLKLEQLPKDRMVVMEDDAFPSIPEAIDRGIRQKDPPKAAPAADLPRREKALAPRNGWLGLYVGGVIVAGTMAVGLGLFHDGLPNLLTVGILCLLAGLAEFYEVKLYDDSTFSVSVAMAFASALMTGVLGVACVSLSIVAVHFYRNREIALYKPVFNWATHVLAGFVPLIAFRVLQVHLNLANLVPLVLLTLASGFAYYLIETGLVSTAIGLSGGTGILANWREQFRWTAIYYIALCVMGLFMSVVLSDADLGLLGLLVFALPLGMIHYAQQQYVERTENSVRELHRMNEELALANRQVLDASHAIYQLNDDLFLTVAKMIDVRDPYVLGHATKVADYALAIAEELNLPAERREQLRQAALFHDIGKIGIPEELLNKPSKLTGLEYEQVKHHTTIGSDLLEASQGLRHLGNFVRHHHEWWNGNGYPDHWRGEEIPLEARILAVSDAVESMASDRPYHRAMQLSEIKAELKRMAGSQFDPLIAQVCMRILDQRGDSMVVNSARQVARKTTANLLDLGTESWWLLPHKPTGGFAPAAD